MSKTTVQEAARIGMFGNQKMSRGVQKIIREQGGGVLVKALTDASKNGKSTIPSGNAVIEITALNPAIKLAGHYKF